jgi:methylglyoxal reductase
MFYISRFVKEAFRCNIVIFALAKRKFLASGLVLWVLKHPGVTVALSSMHIPKYANENIAAVDKAPLSDEVFEEIFQHHRWVRNFYQTKFFI